MNKDTTTMHTIELYACVDAAGDYGVGMSCTEATEHYTNNIGDLTDSGGYRIVKVLVSVTLPEQVEVVATVAGQQQAEVLG